MNEHEKINYVEFPAVHLKATKNFFYEVFNWTFEDFGSDYTAFSGQGLDGGFYKSDRKPIPENGAALVVFYSADLLQTLRKIQLAGGVISKPIFAFPGGKRFHFIEPSGNELAVWSDTHA